MDNLFLILAVVANITFTVFIILMIVSFIKKQKPVAMKRLKFAGVAFGVMIISFIGFGVTVDTTDQEVAGTSQKQQETEKPKKEKSEDKAAIEEKEAKEKEAVEAKAKKEAEAKAKAEKEAKKTPVEKIESIIIDKIDKKTNMDKDRIVSIEDLSDSQDGSYILATLNASENFTNKLTKSGIWMNSIEILEPISKLESTKKIVLQWQLPLTDAYGDTKDGLVMTIDLEREQLDKIKWKNFNGENFAVIANNYFEHPAFNN